MKDCPTASTGFVPVAVETLRNLSDVSFDLYVASDNRGMRLYRSQNVALQTADIDHLLARGVRTLYTTQAMASDYGRHLRERVMSNPELPIADRYAALTAAARTTFNDAMRSEDVGELTGAAEELSGQIVDLLSQPKVLLLDLIGVMLHDFSTFDHATHVSTYCVLLAKQLGISSPEALNEIAQGGLLHDIAKIYVSDQTLQKPGRLSADEERSMRQHPRRGFEELAPRSEMRWGSLMMVYQHHESCDGTGYPVGIVGEEIHPWGRMCAVADVFDALLRDRAYRRGCPVEEVADYLQRQAGQGFDEEMVRCWIKTLSNKP